MLGKLEFLAKISYHFVEEWFAIVYDNLLRHAASIDDLCLNKATTAFFLTFFNVITSTHLEK